MRLTEEQFEALKPYEDSFRKIINARWCPYPGRAAVETMVAIRDQVNGRKERFNAGCSNCVKRLVKELATIYLEDLEERARQEKTVAVKESLNPAPVKVEVKTATKARKGGRNRSETKSR